MARGTRSAGTCRMPSMGALDSSSKRSSRLIEAHERVVCRPERLDDRGQRLELSPVGHPGIELVPKQLREAIARVESVDAVKLEIDQRLAHHELCEEAGARGA